MFDGIPTETFLKDAIVIFGAFSLSKLRTLFKKKQIFYHSSGADYFENCGSLISLVLESNSLFLSLLFNTHEVYLLGLDLAIDEETGATHSEDYEDKSIIDLNDKDAVKQNISISENIFPVMGNFKSKVYTTSIMHSSVQAIYENIDTIKKEEQKIYNLSDGAKLNQTIAKRIEDVDVSSLKSINQKGFDKELYSLFLDNSESRLSDKDILELKRKLLIVQQIKEKIDTYAQQISYSSTDKYLYDMLGIVSEIIYIGNHEIDNIISVYYSYFEYVLPLLLDLLNTQGLKNSKHHIKKLDKLLIAGMKNINKIYGDALENFIQVRC
ncbi:MAG: hypothetical protein Q9M43_02850 [Sulfurimonas sp.]|nr:hypothetical protein [Sulfurimonas sp.]